MLVDPQPYDSDDDATEREMSEALAGPSRERMLASSLDDDTTERAMLLERIAELDANILALSSPGSTSDAFLPTRDTEPVPSNTVTVPRGRESNQVNR